MGAAPSGCEARPLAATAPHLTPLRIQIQETAFLVQVVLGKRFLVFFMQCKDSPAIFLWTRNLPGSAAGARDATFRY